MNTDWTLHGSGRRHRDTWAHLHETTRGWTAAWADHHGFHLDTMPAEIPATTHLWAWTTGRWLRVRIDTPHWWAAVLTPDDIGTGESWTPKNVETPQIHPVLHWNHEDKRVQQSRRRGIGDVFDHDAIQLIPLRPSTAAFLGSRDSLPHHLDELLQE